MARTQSTAELGRLASFPLTNPNPVLETDLDGKVFFMNPASQRLFPKLRAAGLRHPFLSDFASMVRAVKAGKTGTFRREVRVGRAWYDQTAYLVSGEEVLRIYGHDITLRKRTEEALGQSEERFRLIAETSNDIIFQMDRKGKITYCSPAVMQYGYTPGDLVKSHFSRFFSGVELPKAELVFAAAIAGERVDYVELELLTADGSGISSEISLSPLRKGQDIIGLQGVSRDITGRKKAEEYLRRANEDLEVRVRERTQELLTVNRRLASEMKEREDIEQHTLATNELLKLFSHTFLRSEYLDRLTQLLKKWCSCSTVTIQQSDDDGGIISGAYKGFSDRFATSDTGQKNCPFLKKNSCLCSRIMAGRPAAAELSFMTPGGSFYCNDTSCLSKKGKVMQKLFPPECVHQVQASLAIIPVRYRDKTLAVIEIGDRSKEQVPLSLVEFIESMTPLIGEALFRFSVEEAFITSRQQLRELSSHLQSTREEERAKVAREIHDELGQVLTAAMIELSGIRGKYKKQPVLVGKVREVSDLLDGAVRDIQRICSELRPRILDHLGLRAAIEWEAGKFARRSGITCSVAMPPNQNKFPPDVTTALFRICQEALTNVARHSGATEVSVRLAVEDGAAVLEMKDNGRGISREKLAGKKSFGIMGMHERAYDLGGTVFIKGIRNKGTTVRIQVPLPGTRRKND